MQVPPRSASDLHTLQAQLGFSRRLSILPLYQGLQYLSDLSATFSIIVVNNKIIIVLNFFLVNTTIDYVV